MKLLSRQLKRGIGSRCNLSSRYKKLCVERNRYKDRSQEYSRLTIPYILPEQDTERSGGANQHTFQSIGSQACRHLSNKMVTTMFPPHESFFKQEFTPNVVADLEKAGWDKQKLEAVLVGTEKLAKSKQDSMFLRVALTELFKQLIISGNSLLFLDPSGRSSKAIPLDRYAVRLTSDGEILELIIEENQSMDSYPEDIQNVLKRRTDKTYMDSEEKVKFYHYIARQSDGTYCVHQVLDDIQVRDVQTVSTVDRLPWIPVRWNTHYTENYGRGHVEDNIGDIYVVEFLSEALIQGMVLMSQVKYLIKVGSQVDATEFASSGTGAVLSGNIDDIGVMQLEKYADFTPVSAVLEEYKRRIGQNFLLNSAQRRDAERVTTYELRLDAQELEISLGGVYSALSQSLQLPLATRLIYAVQKDDRLTNSTAPVILTGLEALGRTTDMEKIAQYSEMMQLPNNWVPALQDRLDVPKYSLAIANSLSLVVDFMMSDDDYAKKQEADKASEQERTLTEAGAKAIPDMAKSMMPDGG